MSSSQTMRLYYHQLWVVIGWSMVCLVIYLSLNATGVPVVSGVLNDKLIHALGYFGMMLWFMQLYKSTGTRMLFALLFIALGISLEFLQGWGGHRMFEVADMLANAAGIVLGWLAAVAGMDRLLLRFENRLRLNH